VTGDDEMVVGERESRVRRQKRVDLRDPLGVQDRRSITGTVEKARRGGEIGELDAKLHERSMNSLFRPSVQQGSRKTPAGQIRGGRPRSVAPPASGRSPPTRGPRSATDCAAAANLSAETSTCGMRERRNESEHRKLSGV